MADFILSSSISAGARILLAGGGQIYIAPNVLYGSMDSYVLWADGSGPVANLVLTSFGTVLRMRAPPSVPTP
jgi:hypothetical protein